MFFIIIFFWISAVFGETSLFTIIPWFKPNLFFLVSSLFCLRWRGFETHYLAVIFGLTADCFSTVPFGTYGFSFFLISFLIRWYAVRIYQHSKLESVVIIAIVTLLNNLLVFSMLSLLFSEGDMTFHWLVDLVIHEVIPTAILCVPCLNLILTMESRYRIRLAERKF
ncbi:rod shape-determining protein MreD [bacterium]|nr:rod shape-determining protein MreD [bacterium]